MKKNLLKQFYKVMINKIFKPFTDINIKPIYLHLPDAANCLVITPHPGDETLGMGGLISSLPDSFTVFCLTHKNDEEISTEFKAAMKLLRVTDYKMLGCKEEHIISDYDNFLQIDDIEDYDYIFIPYVYDNDSDHKAISFHLAKLLKKLEHKKNLKIAFYELWSTMNVPNYFRPINFVKKSQIIECYKSQNSSEYIEKIGGLNSYRGFLNETSYAEMFTIIDEEDFLKIISELKE